MATGLQGQAHWARRSTGTAVIVWSADHRHGNVIPFWARSRDDMFHARSRTWPRDCRDRHIVLAYRLALQESWGLPTTATEMSCHFKRKIGMTFFTRGARLLKCNQRRQGLRLKLVNSVPPAWGCPAWDAPCSGMPLLIQAGDGPPSSEGC